MRGAHDVLTARVIGRQWWWEIQVPRRGAGPASEHRQRAPHPGGPSGPARARLARRDPLLLGAGASRQAGSRSPGTTPPCTSRPIAPGVFRGQCAEFCGAQHAKMGLLVIAEQPAQFEAWLAQQRRPAAPVAELAGVEARRGQELFLNGTCPMCHAVAGTTRGRDAGPGSHAHRRTRHAGRGQPGQRARAPRALDCRRAGVQARQSRCRRPRCRRRICRRCSRTWRRCGERRAGGELGSGPRSRRVAGRGAPHASSESGSS